MTGSVCGVRDELLEDDMFENLNNARARISTWPRRYNASTHTARWVGSRATNPRANGHNATNNNQRSSKQLVHKTRPGQRGAL